MGRKWSKRFAAVCSARRCLDHRRQKKAWCGYRQPRSSLGAFRTHMSRHAAVAMQKVLAQIEAASQLMSNREKVVEDICNQGSTAINGGYVTQTNLKRLPSSQQSSVDDMVREVGRRLLGKNASEPGPADAQVWADAAQYLHLRIQAAKKEMPGRKRDMTMGAATAMRTVLAQI